MEPSSKSENPFVAVASRKCRNLKKKLDKVLKIENLRRDGKALNEEQLNLLLSRQAIEKSLLDAESLKTQLEEVAREYPKFGKDERGFVVSDPPAAEAAAADSDPMNSPEVKAALRNVLKVIHAFSRYRLVTDRQSSSTALSDVGEVLTGVAKLAEADFEAALDAAVDVAIRILCKDEHTKLTESLIDEINLKFKGAPLNDGVKVSESSLAPDKAVAFVQETMAAPPMLPSFDIDSKLAESLASIVIEDLARVSLSSAIEDSALDPSALPSSDSCPSHQSSPSELGAVEIESDRKPLRRERRKKSVAPIVDNGSSSTSHSTNSEQFPRFVNSESVDSVSKLEVGITSAVNSRNKGRTKQKNVAPIAEVSRVSNTDSYVAVVAEKEEIKTKSAKSRKDRKPKSNTSDYVSNQGEETLISDEANFKPPNPSEAIPIIPSMPLSSSAPALAPRAPPPDVFLPPGARIMTEEMILQLRGLSDHHIVTGQNSTPKGNSDNIQSASLAQTPPPTSSSLRNSTEVASSTVSSSPEILTVKPNPKRSGSGRNRTSKKPVTGPVSGASSESNAHVITEEVKGNQPNPNYLQENGNTARTSAEAVPEGTNANLAGVPYKSRNNRRTKTVSERSNTVNNGLGKSSSATKNTEIESQAIAVHAPNDSSANTLSQLTRGNSNGNNGRRGIQYQSSNERKRDANSKGSTTGGSSNSQGSASFGATSQSLNAHPIVGHASASTSTVSNPQGELRRPQKAPAPVQSLPPSKPNQSSSNIPSDKPVLKPSVAPSPVSALPQQQPVPSTTGKPRITQQPQHSNSSNKSAVDENRKPKNVNRRSPKAAGGGGSKEAVKLPAPSAS